MRHERKEKLERQANGVTIDLATPSPHLSLLARQINVQDPLHFHQPATTAVAFSSRPHLRLRRKRRLVQASRTTDRAAAIAAAAAAAGGCSRPSISYQTSSAPSTTIQSIRSTHARA